MNASAIPPASVAPGADASSVYVMVAVTIFLQLVAITDKFLSRMRKTQCCGCSTELAAPTPTVTPPNKD